MARSHFSLDPVYAREILPGGNYLLFGMECPQPVMAAYERTWARRSPLKMDGDLLVAWAVEQSLMKGDFELGMKLRCALEDMGWKPDEG